MDEDREIPVDIGSDQDDEEDDVDFEESIAQAKERLDRDDVIAFGLIVSHRDEDESDIGGISQARCVDAEAFNELDWDDVMAEIIMFNDALDSIEFVTEVPDSPLGGMFERL